MMDNSIEIYSLMYLEFGFMYECFLIHARIQNNNQVQKEEEENNVGYGMDQI